MIEISLQDIMLPFYYFRMIFLANLEFYRKKSVLLSK